mmetsp:Transcript_37325/g.41248  ORF Transcript_37325/g.41248 Transcript_37325/m.41248 type:complete len:212 (+) Transcript_37325:625-1260(+)
MDKTDHLIQSMIIMIKLQTIAQSPNGFLYNDNNSNNPIMNDTNNDNRQSSSSLLSRENNNNTNTTTITTITNTNHRHQLMAVAKIFDNFDKSGDGSIDTSELHTIFQSIGQSITTESMNAIMHLLDQNSDGLISKDEFINFYYKYIIINNNNTTIDTIAKQLFALFDLDRSGEITLSDFVSVMEGLNVDLTMDEISDDKHYKPSIETIFLK